MIRWLLALLVFCGGPADATCRMALALGLDVSGSVDPMEYRLQRQGLAAALVRPDVEASLLGHGGVYVRLAVYEWSGPGHQEVVVGWTEVTDRAALTGLVQQIATLPPAPTDGDFMGVEEDNTGRRWDPSTALGTAMQTGAQLLASEGDCWQRKLDISGDGKRNTGPEPLEVRDGLVTQGITINALVIGADNPRHTDQRQAEVSELVSYFRTQVILGPGAFVETAIGFRDFEDAMVRKLKRELENPVLSALPEVWR
ncbi:MAG: DUF1194 domain-containing protein [Paracoccaceae bacterium]